MTRSVELEQAIAWAVLRDCQLTDEEFAAQQSVTPADRRAYRVKTFTTQQGPPQPDVRYVPIPYDGPATVTMAIWLAT